jgi:hypothetical protein
MARMTKDYQPDRDGPKRPNKNMSAAEIAAARKAKLAAIAKLKAEGKPTTGVAMTKPGLGLARPVGKGELKPKPKPGTPKPFMPGPKPKPGLMVPQVIDPATGKTRVPGGTAITSKPGKPKIAPGGIGNKEVNPVYRNQGFM